MRRIGVLIGRSERDREGQEWSAALERGLKELGWLVYLFNVSIRRRANVANSQFGKRAR